MLDDWTGLSKADCKTDEEREEHSEWLYQRYLAGREASERADRERQKRIHQGQRAGKKVDGDGYEYAPQLKHDTRTFTVQPFSDEQDVKKEVWNELCQDTWDCVVRLNFHHRGEHGRFASTDELEKRLPELKQRRPEFRALPSEIGQVICWQVSTAFSAFLAAPLVEVDSEPFRSVEPDFSILQRRSTYSFHFTHVEAVRQTRDGGVVFQLPKFGQITCDMPQRSTPEYQWFDGATFADLLTDPLQRVLRIKGLWLYRKPDQPWKARLSFERLEEPKKTKLGVAVDNYQPVLYALYDIFIKSKAAALTAEELRPALAKRGMPITPQELKRAMFCCDVVAERARYEGERRRYYQASDIFTACWQQDREITIPRKLRAELEAKEAAEVEARRLQRKPIEYDNEGKILLDDPKYRLEYYRKMARALELGLEDVRALMRQDRGGYSEANIINQQGKVAEMYRKIAVLEAEIAADQAEIEAENQAREAEIEAAAAAIALARTQHLGGTD